MLVTTLQAAFWDDAEGDEAVLSKFIMMNRNMLLRKSGKKISASRTLNKAAKVFPPMSGGSCSSLVVNSSYLVSPYIPAGRNYPVVILFSIAAAAQVFSERVLAHIVLSLSEDSSVLEQSLQGERCSAHAGPPLP